MIELVTGNLLQSPAQAHVNTVNMVGVMGAGLALQFRHAYPHMFEAYRRACTANKVRVGSMFIVDRTDPAYAGYTAQAQPRWIVNFPTKRHWRQPSQLAYLHAGLVDLVAQIELRAIPSIAIPALGCQNGGLRWEIVEPLIRAALAPVQVHVQLFAPMPSPRSLL